MFISFVPITVDMKDEILKISNVGLGQKPFMN